MPSIEKAKIKDAVQIHKLVNSFAQKGNMLARSLSDIYENIRDYSVIKDGDNIAACGALHVNWVDLAEIKSLAVAEDNQYSGFGDLLVKTFIEEAKELGIPSLFCLTYKPVFFEKNGFKQVDKKELPHKIWGECYRCPKFPDCDEVALIRNL